MRMRGQEARVQVTAVTEKREVKKRIDPDTGLELISHGYYDEIVPPPVPPKTEGYGNTVESIIAHAHYQLIKGWNNPNEPGCSTLASQTYGMAVHAGFIGHMSQWNHNIMAGHLRHGKVDRTPHKVRVRLRDRENAQE